MPYSAEISRANPTCFLFLVDQSRSMLGPLAGSKDRRKADAVADSINRLLYTLVLRCVWGQAVLDRFHLGVLGYGRRVASGFGGALAGRDLVPVSELARNPLRVEQRTQKVDDGSGGEVEQAVKFPVWFEPVADGKTPMKHSLERAATLVAGFLAEHPACYPPVVINLTDGEPTDGDPETSAVRLCQLGGDDGHVLLFNAHISSRPGRPVEFPDREDALADDPARRLFRMSSRLPPTMQAAARQAGLPVNDDTRGFVFNADLSAVIRFLDIGTRVDSKNFSRLDLKDA
jgi:hypothetical protein